ncbi:hypothetical protein AYL99_01462 [Fonsecaea erecta]|uniref:Lanthionine synthetase C-like protein n=1 Tax=Fonsecaea erecta TaxID=1367422 RepID=A0A179A017_9EURO|nr:hypothetical protein AYL99_01462 [Fonsecaea erecta]OAP65490.1 hypothetical protein AYL99_01462 [Fonsecaea erecta]
MASSGRHFPSHKSPSSSVANANANAYEELLASLTRINTYNPPVQTCSTGWTFHGLYYGPTSVAYLFFRLSHLYPDLVFKGQSLLDWAQAYLDLGQSRGRRESVGVDANHCGIGNEVLAQLAIRAAMEQDPSLVQELCSHEPVINGSGGSDEWLYGRAGYLYHLRLARSSFGEGSKASDLIETTIRKTIRRIWASKQPWTWHGKPYVGAAHGTLGILCQLVLSAPSCAQTVEPLLSWLLETVQLPSGNFPSSLPSTGGSDKLVQFCHGAPGAVLALRPLRRHFPPSLQVLVDAAVTAAQKDVWERGLLTKPPCLCHGIAGNALALDDESEFQHFLNCMSTEALESIGWLNEAGRDDHFVGLYTGEAGRAWAWAVADRGLEEKPCIGFNDL